MAAKPKKLEAINPPFEVTGIIGQGSMGEVLLCHDPYLDRMLVVKRMQLSLLESTEMRDRFAREVQVLAYLKHPNIVDIYGYWTSENMLHLSMEFINGWTLRQLLDQTPQPPLWVTLGILWDTLNALAYAHAKYAHKSIGQVTHRDLKPTNMMIGFNGRVTLLDFGISRVSRDGKDITQAGTQVGTVAYMSPEQVNEESVTTSTDIFSLGIIFWEMLSGQHPFRASNAVATYRNIIELEPDVRKLPSHLPKDLVNLLKGMLSKDSDRRPTAQQALDQLGKILAGHPRDLSPYLGHYILHTRKPDNYPPAPEPPVVSLQGPPWFLLAAGVAAGFAIGLLIGSIT